MSERERVPAWMTEHGVKEGEWLSLSKAQLRTMQLPGKPLKVQVWATGMLHSPGYGTEQATTMRHGKKVPLTPGDITKELWGVAKHYFSKAGIKGTDEEWAALRETKEDMRQALSDLEGEGVAERRDAKGTPVRKLPPDQSKRLPSGSTRIFFWLIPRAPDPENVAREWEALQPPADSPEVPDPLSSEGEEEANEVGKISLPLPPIWQILQGLKIGPTETAQIKAQIANPDYHQKVERAWVAARNKFLEVVNESLPEVAHESPPDVGTASPREVGTTGGAFESKGERSKEKATPASVRSSDFSSSSNLKDNKKKNADLPKGDDDEKPKPEYASPREEVKAIFHAKTGEYPEHRMLDRIEGILVTKGESWASYLDVLKPHLGNTWKNPGGFLTDRARHGFNAIASPPQLKPKPKCPTCFADNQRGAILSNGAIVPCPVCSTAEWREELTAKLKRSEKKIQGASGDD